MENTSFMKVDEVAQELGVSKSYAYKIVQRLNAELKEKGILTKGGGHIMAAGFSLSEDRIEEFKNFAGEYIAKTLNQRPEWSAPSL